MTTTRPTARGWGGPPLGVQILALLVAALVVAQLVTMALTIVFPPSPPPRYSLSDIADALAGKPVDRKGGRPILRRVAAGPPDTSGTGWLVSERAREQLATLLRARSQDVTLAFYARVPFGAGTGPRPGPPPAERVTSAPTPQVQQMPVTKRARTNPTPDAPMLLGLQAMPGGPPPGGMPGGSMPGGPPPERGRPDGGLGREPGERPTGGMRDRGDPPTGTRLRRDPDAWRTPREAVRTIAPLPQLSLPTLEPATLDDAVRSAPVLLTPLPEPTPIAGPEPVPVRSAPIAPVTAVAAAPVATRAPTPASRATPATTADPPSALPTSQRGLFGGTVAPFVEGDFVAARRIAAGRWLVVSPEPEGFPSSWQQRVALWFLLSLALVAPFAWLFARRIVRPLKGFAAAAEALGRDPAAAVVPLSGPAEVGRAARAFTLMQSRLRAFVDDRTAMVGAISHDLRTPLTRLRFRIEDVPEAQQDGLLHEVAEMEAMIASVIDFIRDASTPGARERLDLVELADDAVQDARMVGANVTIEAAGPLTVEVDPMGMRRVLDNLLENAVKYGARARVRLSSDGENALAEVIDDGPGIPASEIERAFEPFYRGPSALRSDKQGHGLGLAVCRSIARAHGGDVRLVHAAEGFTAVVAVPLAYDADLPRAA